MRCVWCGGGCGIGRLVCVCFLLLFVVGVVCVCWFCWVSLVWCCRCCCVGIVLLFIVYCWWS